MLVNQYSILDLNLLVKMYKKCGVYSISRYLAKNGVPLNITLAIVKLVKKAG